MFILDSEERFFLPLGKKLAANQLLAIALVSFVPPDSQQHKAPCPCWQRASGSWGGSISSQVGSHSWTSVWQWCVAPSFIYMLFGSNHQTALKEKYQRLHLSSAASTLHNSYRLKSFPSFTMCFYLCGCVCVCVYTLFHLQSSDSGCGRLLIQTC